MGKEEFVQQAVDLASSIVDFARSDIQDLKINDDMRKRLIIGALYFALISCKEKYEKEQQEILEGQRACSE